ncbi:retrovirus-related Pol polyprotein from transposon TNT 1-94 [Trichonephila clavipes]|nr:retrovirus-related Pol polyprotein from transposon TNT 1-94 [Trichonephila clavipes]
MDTYLQLPIKKKNLVTISGFWIVVHPVIWLKNLCGSKNISPEVMDIYLADKNSKMMSQGTGNVSAKTVSTKHCNSINLTITDVSYVPQLICNLLSVTCLMDKGCKIKSENNCVLIYDKNDKLITKAFKNNGRLEIKLEPMHNSECFISDQSTNNYEIWHNSESNGKAERANRVLLERARSLLYESKLPLKFWAEAINCSTQVSNVTPRKGKEKIPLEIWTGNKPKLNYLKKFGCVAYFHVSKVLRNKFEVPERRGIMLGYARERRGYRIYDIKNQKVIEERSVKFNEYLKGSNYLGEIENETWDIDSFFEVSPERNEINQNTENGVLYNFDINNGPGAIENDNSIPFRPRHHLGQAESKFRTRPDISFVISYLSQFNHNPEKRHYNLAKRVLRYLMGSKDKKLFYENEFGILNASSDASWEMQKMENHFLEV